LLKNFDTNALISRQLSLKLTSVVTSAKLVDAEQG